MIFKDLSVLSCVGDFTLWRYCAKDQEMKSVYMVNFFGEFSSLMCVGDVIYLNAKDGTAELVVSKIETGKVWTKVLSKVEY